MNKQSKKEYQPGRIGQLVHYMAEKYSLDERMVRADLTINFPELKDKAHCANCGESMAVYIYSITYLDVRLLCAMASVVSAKVKNGQSFTEANKTHLQSEINNYNLISRQTIASKLGLIAKVMIKDKNGDLIHDRRSGWVITTKGYDFLNHKPVKCKIEVFHNQIRKHFEDTTTIDEVLQQSHGDSEEERYLLSTAGVFVEAYQHPQLLTV